MGTLVNMGVEDAEASECWRLRGESSLGQEVGLYPATAECLGMYAEIWLILYVFLSLEEVLEGLGDWEGV